jgi:hypothetical protein
LDSSVTYIEITVVAGTAEFSLSTKSLNQMKNKATEARRALQNGFGDALGVEPAEVDFTSSDPGKIARAGRRLSDGEVQLLVLNFEITVDAPDSNTTLALLDKIRKITAQDANATASFLAALNAAFEAAGLEVTLDDVMISEPMVMTLFVLPPTPSPTPPPAPAPIPPPVLPPDESSWFWIYVVLFVLFIGGVGAGAYTVVQRQKTAVTKSDEERQQERAARTADDI